MSNGLFITLEGVDGSGKSTQCELLVDALAAAGREVVHLREPGGTRLSEKIRLLVLDPGNDDMCDQCELLLSEAARAKLVCEVIRPALERGATVVCDRFYDSTYAYQAGGRGLAADVVRDANRLGSCGIVPDLTIVYDIDPNQAYRRATQDGVDRLEGEGVRFQQLVREGYLELAKEEPDRVHVIDATGSIEVVYSRTAALVRNKI